MSVLIALLRAVNLGGKSTLPMADLRSMSEEIGFRNVSTYIASGNVIFETDLEPEAAKAALEARLEEYAGRPLGVVMRTGEEMEKVLKANPFPQHPGNRVVALFLEDPPPPDALESVSGANGEEVVLGAREIYVYYVNGQGRSKLKIPAARHSTARNMNTVAKLAAMYRERV